MYRLTEEGTPPPSTSSSSTDPQQQQQQQETKRVACAKCGRNRRQQHQHRLHLRTDVTATRVRSETCILPRSPLIGTRILRERSLNRVTHLDRLKSRSADTMTDVIGASSSSVHARHGQSQGHLTSDDDSGCALEEYAWLPQGLTPSQVS